MRVIGPDDVGDQLNWTNVVSALEAGHKRPKAETGDTLLGASDKMLLSRSARIEGLGFGVKSVTALPDNPSNGLPTVQGGMLVFDEETGTPIALIDGTLITNWKTAADSVLGARLLARPDSKNLLIVGAGTVAEQLVKAYSEIFPHLETIQVWNRTLARAESLTKKLSMQGFPVAIADDLPTACAQADMISCATFANDPVLRGEWIEQGTHVDLIGAFTPHMREADDHLLQKARIFVDSFDTTVEHIGELMIPIAAGAITKKDVLADFYGLLSGTAGRIRSDDITVFKNGGGAHLDLMTAHCILDCLK